MTTASASTSGFFEGIDFANGPARVGRCYLLEGDTTLTVAMDKPNESQCVRAAIDCPLGTTAGFTRLLAGELPTDNSGGFKSRTTEEWLRNQVAAFRTTSLWRNRNKGKKKTEHNPRYKGVTYFNRTGHVQPTVDMTIVPECLWWLGRRLCPEGEKSKRTECLIKARKGDGQVVEAHPRMFLYSLVERVWRIEPAHIGLDVLLSTVQYKGNADHRRSLYRLIRARMCWMGKNQKSIVPVEPPDCLVNSDHMFDAFLSALTAFAHQNAECLDWRAAGIDEDTVEIEGHILILKYVA